MKRVFGLCLMAIAVTASAQKIASQAVDPEIVPARDLKYEQKLDAQLPLDAKFTDQNGDAITLGDTFRDRPVILGLIYYKCPSLCNQILNGMVSTLKVLNFTVGNQFDVVMVGIDEREKPETAHAKLQAYLNEYGRDATGQGWYFLTGERDQIQRVARAVGYSYKFDVRRNQYAHPAGLIVVTPEGKTSRYFLGVEYSARDLKFSLMDASQEKIGSLVDEAVAYCFMWDPHSGKYSLAITRVLQVGGLVTVLCIGCLLVYLVKHSPTNRVDGDEE